MSIQKVIKTDTFEKEVLQSPVPVLVDFGATWCAPCKRLEPILEQLAQEWSGKLQLAKVDVENDPDLAMRYQVMSVPTLILFAGGQPVQKLAGLQSRQKLEEKFSPWITTKKL